MSVPGGLLNCGLLRATSRVAPTGVTMNVSFCPASASNVNPSTSPGVDIWSLTAD